MSFALKSQPSSLRSRAKRGRSNLVVKQIVILLAVLSALSARQACWAENRSCSSQELIGSARILDGGVVTYKGQIITAIMKRGAYSWANLNDGYNAIGVWCNTPSLDGVSALGGYKCKGDILEVTGKFHRACLEHGGELDIHADSVKIVSRGFAIREHVSNARINIGAAFFILTLLAIFAFRKRL